MEDEDGEEAMEMKKMKKILLQKMNFHEDDEDPS